jgi:hypothetical protein
MAHQTSSGIRRTVPVLLINKFFVMTVKTELPPLCDELKFVT